MTPMPSNPSEPGEEISVYDGDTTESGRKSANFSSLLHVMNHGNLGLSPNASTMTATSFTLQDTTLKSRLVEWTDWDWAAYSLGVCLGLMPDEPAFGTAKHVFRSHHPIGRFLYEMLNGLVEQGVLEYRDEAGVQYRWKAAFQGSWD